MSGMYRDGTEDPLSEKEREQAKRYLSDPTNFPDEFVTWLDNKYLQVFRSLIMDRFVEGASADGGMPPYETEGNISLFVPFGYGEGNLRYAGRWSEDGFPMESFLWPVVQHYNYTGTKKGAAGPAPESIIGGPLLFPSDGQWHLFAWVGPRTDGGTYQILKDGADAIPYGGIHVAGDASGYISASLGNAGGDDTLTYDLVFTSDNAVVGSEMRALVMLWPEYVYPFPQP